MAHTCQAARLAFSMIFFSPIQAALCALWVFAH
jgi:hypothetical protein